MTNYQEMPLSPFSSPGIGHLTVDLTAFPGIVDGRRRHLLALRRYGWATTPGIAAVRHRGRPS
ncbi:hypothetical protein ACH427_22950 [Streptomyces sp. NPDC020379]|uniref:hypothetical protein n=1 Tax=Streptomyces sp. NPDC020379 TaxID=3365071 RepID=UPI003787605F